MFEIGRDKDTICAISTAPGIGGIAVVRVSGPEAFTVTQRICPFLPNQPESHRIYYGYAKDNNKEDIDEVLVACFAEGRSFTGEATAEISCHGGTVISRRLLKELLHSGARIAQKGEFTYRAFMRGRIDLAQAESILTLIESQSEQAARVALRQLRGGLSAELAAIEDLVTWVLANLEANIDFAQEDIEVASSDKLLKKMQEAQQKADRLLASYQAGQLLQSGIQVAIVGRPNVGKSSLLNALLNEDKAIVTDIPGTTRDLIEGTFNYRGFQIKLVDTAGLRETADEIEKIGMQKAEKTLSESDLIFYVVDLSENLNEEDIYRQQKFDQKKLVVVGNKADAKMAEHQAMFEVSALERSGLEKLMTVFDKIIDRSFVEDSTVLTQSRHYELLLKFREKSAEASAKIADNASPEFICLDLNEALQHVQGILGKKFDDDVMNRVFQEFCLGK